MKEKQATECYYSDCPLHGDYGVTDPDKMAGPFAVCDCSKCKEMIEKHKEKH